jgi:hypothetical protein
MSFARVRALIVASILLILTLTVVTYTVVSDSQRDHAFGSQCPAGWPTVDMTFKRTDEIKIKVLNATERPGLADSVGTEFTNRTLRVLGKGNSKVAVDGVALLRYGPAAVGSAHVVGAYFLNAAELEYAPARTDDVVDVLIGSDFKQLATQTEFSASIAELAAVGQPKVPPRSCRRGNHPAAMDAPGNGETSILAKTED